MDSVSGRDVPGVVLARGGTASFVVFVLLSGVFATGTTEWDAIGVTGITNGLHLDLGLSGGWAGTVDTSGGWATGGGDYVRVWTFPPRSTVRVHVIPANVYTGRSGDPVYHSFNVLGCLFTRRRWGTTLRFNSL